MNMEAVYIAVAVVTGLGAVGGVTYKCCTTHQQRNIQRIEVNHDRSPSPFLDKIVKESLGQHQRDSDETDIDITIHIENHNHLKKEEK
jgi:hypothetical protein